MPRAGGNYTLPAGYFVTAGDTVQPSQHNPVFEDVASALTGSLPRDGSAAMTAALTLAGDASANLHAVPLQQLNAAIAGLLPKSLVLVASTANLTLSGEQTIDGVLTSSSRVLVKDQSTASQNGIYVTGAGAWTRATDFDAWAEVPGALVIVSRGTVAADTVWLATPDAGGTLGTTNVSFTQISATFSAFGRSFVAAADAAAGKNALTIDVAWLDVASAATVDLGAAGSDNIRITGTTTITSFGTVASGTTRKVRFAAALTLTHNATSLILPSVANITTAANDVLIAVSLGSGNWIVVDYQRASGQALIAGAAILDTQTFTANGTWTKPATGTWAFIVGTGSGAGGGGGQTSATAGAGGSGGGSGYAGTILLRLADLGATESVTVPAGGTGGTAGNAGGNGSNSFFGGWVQFPGGVGGGAVLAAGGNGGSGGGGGGYGGGGGTSGANAGNGGNGGGSGVASGGGVGGGTGVTGSVTLPVFPIFQPGGGGGGGGRTGTTTVGVGGSGGAAAGLFGAGGAGGAAVNGTGVAGSAGGVGAGGGAGGAGVTGGAGGNGGRGEIRVYVF